MKKKKAAVIIAAALTITLGIGATLALLNDTTETAVNTFSSDKSIALELREPAWDGYGFGEDYPDVPGTVAKDPNNEKLGINQANGYVPGDDIAKNPQIKNTSAEESIYGAIRVQYFDGAGNQITYEEFQAAYLKDNAETFGAIEFNTKDWTEIDTGTGSKDYLYRYKIALEKDAVSNPLFTTVPLGLDIPVVNDQGQLPRFQIKVTAYAVQAANTKEVADQELLKLMQATNA